MAVSIILFYLRYNGSFPFNLKNIFPCHTNKCIYCPNILFGLFNHFYLWYNWVVTWDLPGDPVVKHLTSNTVHTSSISGWGAKIPRAVGPLSLSTATRERQRHRYRAGAHARPVPQRPRTAMSSSKLLRFLAVS